MRAQPGRPFQLLIPAYDKVLFLRYLPRAERIRPMAGLSWLHRCSEMR